MLDHELMEDVGHGPVLLREVLRQSQDFDVAVEGTAKEN